MHILKAIKACVAAIAVTAAVPASADIVDLHLIFSASGFVQPGSPYDAVTGDFNIRFDNSANVDITTKNLRVNSFSLPFQPYYSYYKEYDVLTISDATGHLGGCGAGSFYDNVCAFVRDVSTTPKMGTLFYSLKSSIGSWDARIFQTGGSVTVTPIPEPASWAMLIGGFGLTGFALRRRQSPARALAAA